MKAFVEIVRLELRSVIRSRSLAIMLAAAVGWMLAAPHVFVSDGTLSGARELCVKFSLGGVMALLSIALLVSAAGSLAGEREAKRLQLAVVRPVRMLTIVLGKVLAISAVGAVVLAAATAVEMARQDPDRTCDSSFRPILPSPAAEAESMYESYMRDPDTPAAVKKASRDTVLRLLRQRALDHYQTIETNASAVWRFALPENADGSELAVRLRFTNLYDMRDEVRGVFETDRSSSVISNITQAIVRIPLLETRPRGEDGLKRGELRFRNDGKRAVMLRPRKDIELLVKSDGFAFNLVRAYVEMVSLLTLLVAFGVFLGAGLSRPVAVFVAVVALLLSVISPSVLESYPDELETDRADAIGLALTRFAVAATSPIDAVSPLSSLAADVRIEPSEVLRTIAADVILLPFLLSLVAAFLITRKKE